MSESRTAPQSMGRAPDAETAGTRTNASVLGDVLFLMLHSPLHRGWPIMLTEVNILPPIQHKQFRLYHDEKGRPIGFVSWAWLSNEVEKEYATGTYRLKPKDWVSGDNAWIIDFIAPFGHVMAVRKHLRRERVFARADGVCKAFRRVKGEEAIRVMQFGRFSGRQKSNWKSYTRPMVKPIRVRPEQS